MTSICLCRLPKWLSFPLPTSKCTKFPSVYIITVPFFELGFADRVVPLTTDLEYQVTMYRRSSDGMFAYPAEGWRWLTAKRLWVLGHVAYSLWPQFTYHKFEMLGLIGAEENPSSRRGMSSEEDVCIESRLEKKLNRIKIRVCIGM